MLQNDSGLHENRENRIPKNTSRNAPHERSRKSNQNLPKSLHCNNVHNRQSVSTAAVGRNPKPNGTNMQPTARRQIKPTIVSPRIPAWPLRLQRNSIGPNWNQSPGIRRSRQKRNLPPPPPPPPQIRCLVPRPSLRTLLMLQSLDLGNKRRTLHRHCRRVATAPH